MTSKRCARAATKSAWVSTRVTSHTTPSLSRVAWMSSASPGLSSRCRMRSGGVMPGSAQVPLADAARRRLIDDGPEDAELLDGIDEFVKVHRLDHVGVHAEPVAGHHVALLTGGGEHHHRDHAQLLVGLDLP